MKLFSCKVCNKNFKGKRNQDRHYCSRKCMAIAFRTTQKGNNNPNYKGGKIEKVCVRCGKLYSVIPAIKDLSKYCSRACHNQRKHFCKVCKSPISAGCIYCKDHRIKWQHFCIDCGVRVHSSNRCIECYKKLLPGIPSAKCIICAKEFKTYSIRYPRGRFVCSMSCRSIQQSNSQRGEKSHRWRGGLTSESMLIRGSLAYSNWRRQVFCRDNFTCQMCGVVGGKLCADHIKPFSKYPELRLDLVNGRTLCWPCHRLTPTFGHRVLASK